MTIVEIAKMTHEVNRVYCESIGDFSQVPWGSAADWQRESAIQGVHETLSGKAKSPEEQHEAWRQMKVEQGWVYGNVKDAAAKTHPCMVDYHALPVEQRRKDHLFRAVVLALAEAP